MGISSARPADLERFASRSRAADDQLQRHQGRLRSAYGEFLAGTEWGMLDITSLLGGFAEYIDWNEIDAKWVARIAYTFRRAGGDGAIKTLPDAAIHASLKAAHLLGGRHSITFDDPVAYGFPPTSGYANDPVNTASGNFVESETDLPFAGLVTGLTFQRVYNSRSGVVGAFGLGWASWADTRLRFVPDGAEYAGPDGRRVLFARMGEGYGRVLGVDALVEPLGGGAALNWFSGERWEFDEAGLPVLASAGPGKDVRLQYDDGRLVGFAHPGGSRTRLDWDGDRIGGLVSTDGRRVAYRYDDAGNLVAAGRRSYDVDDSGRIVSVVDADGIAEIVNSYDDDGRVLAQISPFGRHTVFGYLPGAVTVTTDEQGGPDNIYIHDEHGRLQAVIDGEGARLALNYDERGNPVAITDRKGAVTVKEWDERANLVRTVTPTGAELRLAYDDRGRVVEVAASSTGGVTRYAYEGGERTPSQITDAEGGVTRMAVEDGLVHTIVDPDGVELRFAFDADGNIVATTDADGNVARLERDESGLVSAAITPLGRRTQFVYDDDGRPVERHDPTGAVYRYEYSAAGRLEAIVDPTGARQEIRYGEHGAVAATVDPLGQVAERRYDVLGNIVQTVEPDGATWRFGYDGVCRVTSIADPTGATWLREYDADGNVVAEVDPAGVRLSVGVDAAGRAAAVGDGLTSIDFEFDELGRVRATRRPDGSEERTEYDRCGRPVAIADPQGATTRIEYTPAGRIARVLAPSGRIDSVYEYDGCGRLAARVDGAGRRSEFRYDADRALVETTAPTGEQERFVYDDGGRLAAWEAPGRGLTSYAYDAAGRIAAMTDRAFGTRRFGHDAAGRLVEATDANGATTQYAYDERGALVQITDPLGGVLTREYDAARRLTRESDQLGRATTIAYDPAGRVVERVDGAGARVLWSYDAAGRVHGYGPAGEEPTTIGYDDLGRPVRIDEPGSFSHRLRYDRAGRLVERRRGALAVRWTYDEDGARSALGLPDGSETTYTHDASGLLTGIRHPAVGAIELERDLAGRLTGMRGDGLRLTWRYDAGELVAYELQARGRTSSTRLRRDAIGRVVAAVVDGAEQPFSYDAAGQLLSAGERAFTYDAGGRLTSERSPAGETAYEHDAAGQLVARRPPKGAATQYAYDGAGRRVRETAGDLARAFRWDARGRLVAIESGERTTQVRVDALGELAEVDGTPLLWDGEDPLSPPAWIGGRTVIGLGSPWAIAAGDSAEWLAPDWHGTAGGPRDPWGAPAADGGPQLGLRGEVEFAGETWLRNRVYEPASRAFLQPDPLAHVAGTPGAANPYAYAANNPLGLADPLGLRPVTDQELRDIRDRMGRDVFEKGADWAVDNWEYIAAGALVVGGVALMCTGVGGPAGMALVAGASGLVSAGGSIAVQKLTTGDVNWTEVGVQGLIGVGAGALGWGAGGLVVGGSRAASIGRGALSGGVESVTGGMANRGLHGGNVLDPRGMGTDALLGVGGGGAGGRISSGRAGRGTALSGHGDWAPNMGHTTIPPGTTLTTYAPHGWTIQDSLGQAIETGRVPSNPHYSHTYGPGDQVPDYRLSAPFKPNLSIRGTPHTVLRPHNVSELLRPNMGDVHWAACVFEDAAPFNSPGFPSMGLPP